MQISESHRQLLVTMLQYELANFLEPRLTRAHEGYMGVEAGRLETVKKYFRERIDSLKN